MTDQPRYCERCGSQIRSNAKFCPQCGAPQSETPPAPPPAQSPVAPTQVAPVEPGPAATEYMPPPPAYSPQPPAPDQAVYAPPPQAPQAPKRNRTCLILAAAAAAVLLLACCLLAGLGLWNYYPTDEATSTPTIMSVAAAPLPQATVAEPTLPVEPPAAKGPGMKAVDFANIHFRYPADLAAEVLPESAPAYTDPNGPIWDLVPQHTLFNFVGYPLHPEAFHEPRLYVYPVDEYRAISPDVGGVIDDLRAFLDRQPAQLGPDETIPFLPVFNAAQVMQARIAYLEFQNGRGVRFLTQYAQNTYPINNRDLFYTFQGLTHDGRYYLAAVLPVTNPILDNADATPIDDNFINNFSQYIAATEEDLSAQPPESFSPNLDWLDEMLSSFLIE